MTDTIFTDLPNSRFILVALARLAVAIVFGGIIGLEREQHHKAAGLRTHMLVAGGAALFVLAPLEAGATMEHITRVIQGLTTGIGFLGGGTILKLQEQQLVLGLTTAATIWMTAAIGMAAGIGWFWPAFWGLLLTLAVVYTVRLFEPTGHSGPRNPHQ